VRWFLYSVVCHSLTLFLNPRVVISPINGFIASYDVLLVGSDALELETCHRIECRQGNTYLIDYRHNEMFFSIFLKKFFTHSYIEGESGISTEYISMAISSGSFYGLPIVTWRFPHISSY
jgi:hypothetical protein